MKYKFCDLVDLQQLFMLMQELYRASGIPSGIIDIDGTILVAVGWQEICRDYHRQHACTKQICQQSDDYVKQCCLTGEPYIAYRCPLGLMDAAAPIIIDGDHVATVFQGQFFFEQPDIECFRGQAKQYGFEETGYLSALDKVPIYTYEKLDSIMRFFTELARMLAELGFTRLQQIEKQTTEMKRNDKQIYTIFNSTPNVAIQGYDENGSITFWNNASQKLYGFECEDVLGKPAEKLIFDQEEAESLAAVLKQIHLNNSLYGPAEWTVKHKNGQEKIVSSTLFPINLSNGKKEYICMDVDITEQKKIEAELERLDRMQLVGEMAASLAHEIRNPMTTVRGYLQMLRNKACFQEHLAQFDTMIEELDSANQIIREYLSLAKNKSIERKIGDLNQIIEALLPLLYAEAINERKIITWEAGKPQSLLLDDGEIKQLIINIVRNALEAVDKGGLVRISTMVENGEFVLRVQDNGKGIPKELLNKVGTPFVTTKPLGTGLGLAVCFSIASRHHARISIQSSGTGTTVSVNFVVADQ
ncbi:PAS domain S-box protein [bacterium BFN5]|nr:PAS domain S-box protein [bacterium BFN5]QJW45424.1 PAS domain S-box protein [bacterium BFN5]